MGPCEAPCEPACVRLAVSTVQWRGHPIRVCQGHKKRADRGLPIHERLANRTPRGAPEGTLVMLGARVPPALKEDVEREAERRGLAGAGEATRQALALWLATTGDELEEKLGEAATPASSSPRPRG